MATTYQVRISGVPGRLSVVVPAGHGLLLHVCAACKRILGEIPTPTLEDDGLTSHGLCPSCSALLYGRLGEAA